MNKRLLITITLCLMSAMALSGCKLQVAKEPEATLPPGLTKTEGRIVSTDPKIVEGRVTKLTDKAMCITVQGVEWELLLSEESKFILQKFEENGDAIVTGTYVMIYYEENENGQRVAGKINRVIVN